MATRETTRDLNNHVKHKKMDHYVLNKKCPGSKKSRPGHCTSSAQWEVAPPALYKCGKFSVVQTGGINAETGTGYEWSEFNLWQVI